MKKLRELHQILTSLLSLADSLDQKLTEAKEFLKETVDEIPISKPPPVKLSNQEKRVLILVAKNKSIVDISKALKLSPRTIDAHKYNIRRKMGIDSRGDLVVAAKKWLAVLGK